MTRWSFACPPWGSTCPGIEVRIVDPETNREVAPGTQGEVVCRGYNVMKGYYNMPEETARGHRRRGLAALG